MAFVKLDCGILDSTLWPDREGREMFITALLMAEPIELEQPTETIEIRSLDKAPYTIPPGWYGFVGAASTGIARRAGIESEAGLSALERLASPESESRTPDHEGRRMVRVDGGFIILNFDTYRRKDHSAAERSARYRSRLFSKRENIAPSFSSAWDSIVAYYGGNCAYCGKLPWTDIDHVIPTSKGGKHSPENCVPSCKSCNSSKKDTIPTADKWVPVKPHPLSRVLSSLSRVTGRSITQAEAEAEAEEKTLESGDGYCSSNAPSIVKVASLPRFQKPSLEVVMEKALEIGLPSLEAQKFYNYYESNGWRVGKNPMKSWTHALQNWKNNAKSYGSQKLNPRNLGVNLDAATQGAATVAYLKRKEAHAPMP